jgi:lipopolysaccharide heptosyltransferase I
MTEPRFLVVRLSSLGDIVHTFPAVAALRATFPSTEIVWLTHPRWKLLVETSGLASQIWTVETRSFASVRETIRQIRKANFSVAIDYQGLWKSASLPFLSRVSRRIGFSSETIREFGVPLLYTERVRASATHIAEQNGELALSAGARDPVAKFNLRVPEQGVSAIRDFLRANSLDRYIVLSPGGGWRSKCWPAQRFGALCHRIHSSLGLRCVINYGPGEEALASAVQSASGDGAPLLYNGDLSSLMALLRNAVCIVGGDTGPLHLAVALGTPAVAIFGPTNPARNGPYPPGDIVIRASNVVTTHAREEDTHPSLLSIEVDAVFEAVCRRIGAAA